MRIILVLGILGKMLLIIGGSMAVPLAWSLYYGEADAWPIFYAMLLTLAVGAVLAVLCKSNETIRTREGFAIVTLGWVVGSAFGSLPYLLSGALPSVSHAYFETMSGFTTTGASVFTDVESLSKGILFWRSLTHWLGGMGIMVLLIALLAQYGGGGLQMFKAESPGPVAERIKPRIQETAKILWLTYVIMSVVLTVLLMLGGVDFFNALCHTFGAMATGGFSTWNKSVGHYDSAYVHWVITIFCFLAGANFALYYQALHSRSNAFWHNEEFRLYVYIVLGATALVFIDLILHTDLVWSRSLRDAAFQVVTIITTTGYATADFDKWPALSRVLLFILMFIGGCSGSTGGAIKVGRLLIVLKNGVAEISRLIHPRAVVYPKLGGKTVPEAVVINTLQFIFLYILVFFIGIALMAGLGVPFTESLTSVAATLGNVGPGLGSVGPAANYDHIPALGKWFLSLFMLLGRLELYTVFVLFSPDIWRK